MRKRKRTETIIEIEQVFVIRKLGRPLRTWCPECKAETEIVTPDEAAILIGVSSRTIYYWVEKGRLHFTEVPEGLLRICLNSLLKLRA